MGRIFLVVNHPNLRQALANAISEQSQGTLSVVGAASWDRYEVKAIRTTHPDVVILVVGIESSHELAMLEHVQAIAPGIRVLLVDTLGGAGALQATTRGMVDGLISPERLAWDLVPMIRRLIQIAAPLARNHDPLLQLQAGA